MAIEPIDYDVLTSTPDERAAIDAVNAVLSQVEALKGDHRAAFSIASFESWYGGLKERQSHWTIPGVVKSHRVDQSDVNEAERLLYAVKSSLGVVTPDDTAPPDEVPHEQDPIEAASDAVKTGLTFAGLGLAGYLLYKLLS